MYMDVVAQDTALFRCGDARRAPCSGDLKGHAPLYLEDDVFIGP